MIIKNINFGEPYFVDRKFDGDLGDAFFPGFDIVELEEKFNFVIEINAKEFLDFLNELEFGAKVYNLDYSGFLVSVRSYDERTLIDFMNPHREVLSKLSLSNSEIDCLKNELQESILSWINISKNPE